MLKSIYKADNLEKIDNSNLGIFDLFYLFLKTVYSTTLGKILIIFSPIVAAFALTALFPPYFATPIGQIFVGPLSAGIVWGMTYFSIRRTTFYDNLRTTKISMFKVYMSIWMIMVFVTFFSEATYWLTVIILDSIGIQSILSLLINFGSELTMNWMKVDWFTMGYVWIGSITFVFVVSFALRSLFNSEKTYFIILLIYILFLIPFGGILRPIDFYSSSDNIAGEIGIQINKPLTFTTAIGLFIPQYHFDMFIFSAISSGTFVDGHSLGYINAFDSFVWSSSWQWNMSILYPPIIGILFIAIDFLTIHKH